MNQRSHQLTIPIDQSTNTSSFYTSSGIKKYANHIFQNEKIYFTRQSEQYILYHSANIPHQYTRLYAFDDYNDEDPAIFQKDNNKTNIKLYDEAYSNMLPSDLKKEFVKWHHRLGHMSCKKMKMLSIKGIIPKKLKDCDPPACANYIYGGITKRP